MKHLFSAWIVAIALAMGVNGATAGVIYTVDRSWTNGVTTASLVGTVDVDIGNYDIQNGGSSPFNAFNLTLSVGGTSYDLDTITTDLIAGAGLFNIQATASELIFSATGDESNPADLVFSDGDIDGNRYAIGVDASPAFEIALAGPDLAKTFVVANPGPVFPVVWATVSTRIPEPSTLAMFGLGIAGLGFAARRPRSPADALRRRSRHKLRNHTRD